MTRLLRIALPVLLATLPVGASVIVNFTLVPPPGNPTVIAPGDSVFVVLSVFNQTPNTIYLWQAGFGSACGTPPCASLPAPVFNEPGVSDLFPFSGTGLAPGGTFLGTLWTQVFDVSSPQNPYRVYARVNFTDYSSANDIYSPFWTVIVTPEPSYSALMSAALLLLAARKQIRQRIYRGVVDSPTRYVASVEPRGKFKLTD